MAAGAALAAKRGERPQKALKGASKSMVKSMSEKQLEELASAKRKKLPTRAGSTKSSSKKSGAKKSGGKKSSNAKKSSSSKKSGGSKKSSGKKSGRSSKKSTR